MLRPLFADKIVPQNLFVVNIITLFTFVVLCGTICRQRQRTVQFRWRKYAMNYLCDKLNNVQAYQNLLDDTRDKKFITAFGVQPNEKPFIASSVKEFCLYVCADYVESQRVLRTVQALSSGNVVYVPAKDDVLLHKRNGSKNAVYQRNFALHQIVCGASVAVCCVDALMQFLPSYDKFCEDSFVIAVGVEYDRDMLVSKLVANGFTRVDGIQSEGEFVVRGDILEISLPFGKRYRVDFWDNQVENIKTVAEDGKANGQTQQFDVYPLYETSGISQDDLQQVRKLCDKVKVSPDAKVRLGEIVDEISAKSSDGNVDSGWLVPFCQNSRLRDYLPSETTVIWDEPKLLQQRANFIYNEHNQRVVNLTKAGEVLPIHFNSLCDQHTVWDVNNAQLALQTLTYQSFFVPSGTHNFKTTAVYNYAGQSETLAKDIHNWIRTGYEVLICAGNDGVEITKEQLAERKVYVAESDLTDKSADALLLPIGIEHGFVSHSNKLAVIGTRDLGRGISQQTIHKSKKQAFLSVEKGDYVVHDVHGIGLCEGIQKVKSSSGEMKDYVVVLYKNGDRLYVPAESTDLLSRYSGGENPTLSKLGGEDFTKVKNKVKASIKEMSVNLIKLYAERQKPRGFCYRLDEYLQQEFEQHFPFKPTADQIKCQEEIERDLISDKIMDRILVGDVGYGKTEVAMRCAFDVVSNGYQVAVLCPTTILAEQHYKTFVERMQHFDIRVVCLNRFRTAEEQDRILKDLSQGKVDIIIGTHRLLSKDVDFARLGLLVLDEEQRFGVEHKEKIKALKTSVDVLTMSATPIPRTLHMALTGIRDISTITTPPVERIAVETFVAEESLALICDVITRELARGGQVYCVYNKVQSIDSFAYNLQQALPNVKFVVAHGQMSEVALEDAVHGFANGNGDVLVCSTIIENGIDIPNANTLIVTDADKLGLSQLYQLRGRVGRSNKLAYAYFLYQHDKVLSEVAYKRLSSITEYSELGSGFKIAMKDLEIRGAGNILGREQHGHMVKVGYDMYARLLKQAIAEAKGEKSTDKFVTDIEYDVEAYAPETYITSQHERMDFYQQLAGCTTLNEIQSTKRQVADIYGAIPKQMENLFDIATVKVLANNAGICKVAIKVGRGILTFANKEAMFNKKVFDALDEFGGRASCSTTSYSITFASPDYLQKDRLFVAVTDFLQMLQSN